jgi:hypothetical protein
MLALVIIMRHTNTKEEIEWWETLDMNCEWLGKLCSGMYGTKEQRVSQLYIIRKSQNFTLKTKK